MRLMPDTRGPKPSTRNLLLFDFDGVVVDSLEMYESAVDRCFEKIGLKPIGNRAEFLTLFEENFYEGIARRGADIRAFSEASASIAPGLDYRSVVIHSDVLEALRILKDENDLAVISSNTSFAISAILPEADSYFDRILGCDFRLSKVEKILYAMELFRIGMESTFYIGDTTGDIREARAAGVKTVAAAWGWHPREMLEKAQPDFLIDSPFQLLDLVKGSGQTLEC
jgi:phosphoglycolate phosphatase